MCDKSKKIKMKDLIEHVYVEHDGISPYYPIDPLSRQLRKYDNYFYNNAKDEVIKSIIALHMVAKQGKFKCKGCRGGTIIPSHRFALHIMHVHNRIVDQ